MFRKMRRFKQQISTEECKEILTRATSGVLGLYGDDGYPYTVPISFVYEEGRGGEYGTISFHCARTGHKIDAIRRNEKVSFTVIDRDEVMPKERTTKYCSVIAFGRARFVEGEEEMRRSANTLGAKYSSGFEDLYRKETEDTLRAGTLCCIEMQIDYMTGKIGREVLVERQREKGGAQWPSDAVDDHVGLREDGSDGLPGAEHGIDMVVVLAAQLAEKADIDIHHGYIGPQGVQDAQCPLSDVTWSLCPG